jgi:hypothetical protein
MGMYAAQPWENGSDYSKLTDYISLFGLLLWAILPYLSMFIIIHSFSKRIVLIRTFSAVIFIISIFSAYILFDAMFVHPDAQGGLVFIILPIYQWVALIVFLIIYGIVYKSTKKEN